MALPSESLNTGINNYKQIYIYTYVQTYIHTCTGIHANMSVYFCVCVHMYIHTSLCVYTYTYIYRQIDSGTIKKKVQSKVSHSSAPTIGPTCSGTTSTLCLLAFPKILNLGFKILRCRLDGSGFEVWVFGAFLHATATTDVSPLVRSQSTMERSVRKANPVEPEQRIMHRSRLVPQGR